MIGRETGSDYLTNDCKMVVAYEHPFGWRFSPFLMNVPPLKKKKQSEGVINYPIEIETSPLISNGDNKRRLNRANGIHQPSYQLILLQYNIA